MKYLELMNNQEKQDVESALAMLKSIKGHIDQGNYNSAISSLGSVALFLTSAEANSRIHKFLQRNPYKSNGFIIKLSVNDSPLPEYWKSGVEWTIKKEEAALSKVGFKFSKVGFKFNAIK